MEYKRPTKIVDLPSGKKVEIIEYFSKNEIEELRSVLLEGRKISVSKINQANKNKAKKDELLNDIEFDLSEMSKADKLAREFAVKKMIDVDGKEYEGTPEGLNEFLNEEDGTILTEKINEMSKKKPIKKS
jgi:hypothetical protein